MNRFKLGVSKVRLWVLFLGDPDGYSSKKKLRDRLIEHRLAEVDISNREHGWWHQLKYSREV